jgi:hypothetical protein
MSGSSDLGRLDASCGEEGDVDYLFWGDGWWRRKICGAVAAGSFEGTKLVCICPSWARRLVGVHRLFVSVSSLACPARPSHLATLTTMILGESTGTTGRSTVVSTTGECS